jgi:hypothetical protein
MLAQWFTTIIPAFERQRQENQEFEVTWLNRKTLSQKEKKKA